jgi:hypothetical protein
MALRHSLQALVRISFDIEERLPETSSTCPRAVVSDPTLITFGSSTETPQAIASGISGWYPPWPVASSDHAIIS